MCVRIYVTLQLLLEPRGSQTNSSTEMVLSDVCAPPLGVTLNSPTTLVMWSPSCRAVYQALYLEELTLLDLSEKIAMLYSITPQQITHIYRQKPNGIHVLVSDEVSPLTLRTFHIFPNVLSNDGTLELQFEIRNDWIFSIFWHQNWPLGGESDSY